MASANFIRLLDGVQCGVGTDDWVYGDGFAIAPYMNEFLLVGKCICEEKITLKYKVEHSPDGIRWSPLVNSDGTAIKFECISTEAEAAVQTCAIQIVDTPVLPYIRGICGEADDDEECECTLDLYYENLK